MHAATFALLLTGAGLAGAHDLAGPGWSADLSSDSRTFRFGATKIRMHIADGNASASLTELPGRIRYSEVYDGIHLDFYRAGNALEYDFVITPGADPSRIAMMFPGAQSLAIDANGELIVTTAAGEVRHRAPVSYQTKNGRIHSVASRFVLNHDRVGFEVGAYDATMPLVIDPVITQRTLLGTTFDLGTSYARDSAGNSYLGAYSVLTNTSFLKKSSPTGALLSSTVLPIDNGPNTTFPPTFFADFRIAVDAAQNVYVGSQSKSCPANATRIIGSVANPGTFLLIFKLLPDAATISYLTCVQLDRNNKISDITIDTAGNAYIVGSTEATIFPATSTFGPILTGLSHGFITKVDPTGQSFTFSIVFGSGTEATSVARDAAGNILVGGFTGPDFQTVNARQATFGGGATDGFVMKVSADGLQVLNSTFHGGNGADKIRDLVLQTGNGQVTVGGETASTNYPLQGTAPIACSGTDGFITRFDAALANLLYSTCAEGTTPATVSHLALLGAGGILAAGQYAGDQLLIIRLENSGKLLYTTFHTYYRAVGIVPLADGFILGGTETFLVIVPSTWQFQERADLLLKVNNNSASAQNQGPDPATGVLISISVPSGVLQVNDSRCATSTRTATCKIGTLLVGETFLVNFSASTTPTVQVSSQMVDPSPGNNHN